jgi:putative addiction module component (TIGR02574 family)
MSIPERILLVEEIWDSIVADEGSVEITPEQRAELDRRLAAHDAAPDEGSSWDEVRSRLQGNP